MAFLGILVFVIFIVGIVALVKGKLPKVGIKNRKVAAIVTVLSLILLIVLMNIDGTNDADIDTATGQQDTEQESVDEEVTSVDEEVENDTEIILPSYDVVEIEDLAFSNVKRYNWNVVVHDEVTEDELILLSEQIVQEAKEVSDFNALSIMYYDYEEYIGFGYTLGSVDFAPGGDWGKADTVSTGDYDKMSFKYSLRVKDWSQRLTQEEVNIWSEWSSLVYDEALDEAVATETVAAAFNVTEDEVDAIIRKQMSWTFQDLN